MKNIIFSSLIILISFCSCKKDRTCVCTNSAASYEAGVIKATKFKAKKDCKALSGGDTNCEIK